MLWMMMVKVSTTVDVVGEGMTDVSSTIPIRGVSDNVYYW
jgi:hypothetical protein